MLAHGHLMHPLGFTHFLVVRPAHIREEWNAGRNLEQLTLAAVHLLNGHLGGTRCEARPPGDQVSLCIWRHGVYDLLDLWVAQGGAAVGIGSRR